MLPDLLEELEEYERKKKIYKLNEIPFNNFKDKEQLKKIKEILSNEEKENCYGDKLKKMISECFRYPDILQKKSAKEYYDLFFIENIINNKTFETMFIKQKIEVQNDILEKIKKIEIDNVLILKSITKIQLKLDEIIIHHNLAAIFNYLTGLNFEAESTQNYTYEEVYDAKVSTIKQMKNKIILANKRRYNEKLIQAIVKSFWYNNLGAQGKMTAEIRNGSCKKVKNLSFTKRFN